MHCKKNFRISADISAKKIKKARFGNFTKRGEIKPTYPQADCGYERKKTLFGGFCLGKTRHARDRLNRTAFAQKVDAFKTLENAALFGRCGTTAFETAMLGHNSLLL